MIKIEYLIKKLLTSVNDQRYTLHEKLYVMYILYELKIGLIFFFLILRFKQSQ